jgi:succinate dehydrogenase / fumarate reductase, membrane anchor subunit
MVNLVSPLGRVLGLGSAKDGAEHWWMQRLTSVALVPLGLWLAIALARLEDFSHAIVSAWVAAPVNAVLLILTVLATIHHSRLGVQVVIEDYVRGKSLKVTSLMLSTLIHFAVATAALFAILKVAFGAAA